LDTIKEALLMIFVTEQWNPGRPQFHASGPSLLLLGPMLENRQQQEIHTRDILNQVDPKNHTHLPRSSNYLQ
jgi:hypothetical protein